SRHGILPAGEIAYQGGDGQLLAGDADLGGEGGGVLVLAVPGVHVEVEVGDHLAVLAHGVGFDAGVPGVGAPGDYLHGEEVFHQGENSVPHPGVGEILANLRRVHLVLLAAHQFLQVGGLPALNLGGLRLDLAQAGEEGGHVPFGGGGDQLVEAVDEPLGIGGVAHHLVGGDE